MKNKINSPKTLFIKNFLNLENTYRYILSQNKFRASWATYLNVGAVVFMLKVNDHLLTALTKYNSVITRKKMLLKRNARNTLTILPSLNILKH